MTTDAEAIIEKTKATPLTRKGIEEFYDWLIRFRDRYFFNEQFPIPGYCFSKKILSHQAYLITIDGISGAGKDTQIELLEKRIQMSHRGNFYCQSFITKYGNPFREILLSYWKEHSDNRDHRIEIPLLWVGRKYFIEEILTPALAKAPGVVLQNRSYLADVVFMTGSAALLEQHLELCWFDPAANLPIVLIVEPCVAFERVRNRARSTGSSIQPQEQPANLEHTAALYQLILKRKPSIAVPVYANDGPGEVHERIWQLVEQVLPGLYSQRQRIL